MLLVRRAKRSQEGILLQAVFIRDRDQMLRGESIRVLSSKETQIVMHCREQNASYYTLTQISTLGGSNGVLLTIDRSDRVKSGVGLHSSLHLWSWSTSTFTSIISVLRNWRNHLHRVTTLRTDCSYLQYYVISIHLRLLFLPKVTFSVGALSY